MLRGAGLAGAAILGKSVVGVLAPQLGVMSAAVFAAAMNGRGEFSFLIGDVAREDEILTQDEAAGVVWALLAATLLAPVGFRPLLALSEQVPGLWASTPGRMPGFGSGGGRRGSGGGAGAVHGGEGGAGDVEMQRQGGAGRGGAAGAGHGGEGAGLGLGLGGASAADLLQADDVLRPLPAPGDRDHDHGGVTGRGVSRHGGGIRGRGGQHRGDFRLGAEGAGDGSPPDGTEVSLYEEGESVLSEGSGGSAMEELEVHLGAGAGAGAEGKGDRVGT